MSRKDLKNKPLVEAILEIRWHLVQPPVTVQGPAQMMLPAADPHYRLLLGRLFDRLQKEYPVHEQLPTAICLTTCSPTSCSIASARQRTIGLWCKLVRACSRQRHPPLHLDGLSAAGQGSGSNCTTPTPTSPSFAFRASCSVTSTPWSTIIRTRTLSPFSGIR